VQVSQTNGTATEIKEYVNDNGVRSELHERDIVHVYDCSVVVNKQFTSLIR